jgi:hypothetical protein
VQQMTPIFFSDVSRFGSDSGFPERLVEGVFCAESGKGIAEIWWRFGGGSDRNRALLGELCNSMRDMHIAQSRINTGDFASC